MKTFIHSHFTDRVKLTIMWLVMLSSLAYPIAMRVIRLFYNV